MIYTQKLPKVEQLNHLAESVPAYPETARNILILARDTGFDQDVLTFLSLFEPDHYFSSKEDFLIDCEELELLIQEEQSMPKERLRSPQD